MRIGKQQIKRGGGGGMRFPIFFKFNFLFQMASSQSAALYEPEARWAPSSAVAGCELLMWGGRLANRSSKIADNTIEVFNQMGETWRKVPTCGECPPWLYDGASTTSGHNIYTYGGYDGTSPHGSLHVLDTISCKWSQLVGHSPGGPMRKRSCGVVTYSDQQGNPQLLLFGGFGPPSNPLQPGSEWVKCSSSGWTNELHTFDITKGKGLVL